MFRAGGALRNEDRERLVGVRNGTRVEARGEDCDRAGVTATISGIESKVGEHLIVRRVAEVDGDLRRSCPRGDASGVREREAKQARIGIGDARDVFVRTGSSTPAEETQA